MAPNHWLLHAVATADDYYERRQQQNNPPNTSYPGETSGESSDSDSDSSSSCSDMTSTQQPDVVVPDNLADYGPTFEEHETHVKEGLGHLGPQSTKHQYGRKFEEYQEFAKGS